MSTRANIIIEETSFYQGDKYTERLYFYRHSDGYPEGVKDTLNKFVDLLKKGKIRNNVNQSAGWLILLGAMEYQTMTATCFLEGHKSYLDRNNENIDNALSEFEPTDWKCGAYEPTTGLHGDIEHLYLIDLKNKEWREISRDDWNKYEK